MEDDLLLSFSFFSSSSSSFSDDASDLTTVAAEVILVLIVVGLLGRENRGRKEEGFGVVFVLLGKKMEEEWIASSIISHQSSLCFSVGVGCFVYGC